MIGRLTAGVTGGWGEKGSEMENCHSLETASKNAQSPSRPVYAVLGGPFNYQELFSWNKIIRPETIIRCWIQSKRSQKYTWLANCPQSQVARSVVSISNFI